MGVDIKKGSLSYNLLTVLEKTADGYIRFEDFISRPGFYAYYDGWEHPIKKSALSKAIARLKKKGFLKKEKVDEGEIFLKLTDEGKTALLLVGNEEEVWDGKWRIVIFDIPEEKRVIRNLLRRNLKKWGFKHLQKSVWISKKNIMEKLCSYIADLGIEKWVWVFESEKYGPMDIQ